MVSRVGKYMNIWDIWQSLAPNWVFLSWKDPDNGVCDGDKIPSGIFESHLVLCDLVWWWSLDRNKLWENFSDWDPAVRRGEESSTIAISNYPHHSYCCSLQLAWFLPSVHSRTFIQPAVHLVWVRQWDPVCVWIIICFNIRDGSTSTQDRASD